MHLHFIGPLIFRPSFLTQSWQWQIMSWMAPLSIRRLLCKASTSCQKWPCKLPRSEGFLFIFFLFYIKTLYFKCHQRKYSQGVRSGDLGSYVTAWLMMMTLSSIFTQTCKKSNSNLQHIFSNNVLGHVWHSDARRVSMKRWGVPFYFQATYRLSE